MADFAPVNTSRYKVRYRAAGLAHDMVFRYDGPTIPPPTAFKHGVNLFLDSSSDLRLTDWQVLGEFYALKDSNTFLPLPVSLTVAPGTQTIVQETAQGPVFMSYVGLTSAANAMRIMVFGVKWDAIQSGTPAERNYRVTAAESGNVASTLTNLAGVPDLVGIDGLAGFWHQYVNVKEHSHYVYKARS